MIEVEERTQQLTEPPKRWRNWYRILPPPPDVADISWAGTPVKEGDVMPAKRTHPTKEIAEQRALDMDAREAAKHGYQTSEWLGAFPEGERP